MLRVTDSTLSNDYDAPVIITGGAQRLGLATALDLQARGYKVTITYRKQRPLLEDLRRRGIETLHADFGDESGIARFIDELGSRYESIRAIIHNASEWMPESSRHKDASTLRAMLDIHVATPFLINQACGDMLVRHGEIHGYADIIHMTDYVATTGSKNHIAYAASKGALDNLTLSFASKFAPSVKVNSIAPALLMFNEGDDESYRAKARQKSLLGIVPGESEGVNTIRYILESRYLTGKSIALDGGRHLARAS